jgi:hypothetical protein
MGRLVFVPQPTHRGLLTGYNQGVLVLITVGILVLTLLLLLWVGLGLSDDSTSPHSGAVVEIAVR